VRPARLLPVRRLQRARLVRRWIEDDLGARLGELLQPIALDVLELHAEHARLGPFALRVEADLADDGLEGVAVDVVGELGVVEAAGDNGNVLGLRQSPRWSLIST